MRNVGKEIFKRLGMQIWFSDGTNEKKQQFVIREYNVLTNLDGPKLHGFKDLTF